MAELDPLRSNIHEEETRYKASVSEAVGQKIGGAINFINERQHSEKRFLVNGIYSGATLPYAGIDGLVVFQYDAEIIDVWMFNLTAGASGTTTFDLKLSTSPGGAFSTILTTTPSITSAAGNNVWVGTTGAVSGCTNPVILTSSVSAGDALRCDLTAVQTGTPSDCGVIIHYRPR